MTRTCYIKSCKKEIYNQPGVTFHRLPFSNADLLKQWLEKIGRDQLKISKYTLICSNHFHNDCFDKSGSIVRLKEDAYPTLNLSDNYSDKNIEEHNCSSLHKLQESQFSNQLETPRLTRPISRKRLLFNYDEEELNRSKKVKHDHTYAVNPTTDFRQKYLELKKQLKKTKTKIQTLQKTIVRQKKKIHNFTDLIKNLREKDLITTNTSEILQNCIEGAPKELFGRFANKKFNKGKKYPPELRKFALTLNFLSTRAYEYVREVFGKALPHRNTISRWYQHIDGRPGLCRQAITAIQKYSSGKNILGCLMFDEMSIRKHVDFYKNKNIGFVDFGLDENDSLSGNSPLAGHALVFMVVALNGSWKIPVSYYLTESLTGAEMASITISVLESLQQISFPIVSLTCDAPSSHLKMAEELGVSFNLDHFTTVIEHPLVNDKTFFMLDNCHVIKLMRNLLFEYRKLYDPDGYEINVKYIEHLHEIQQNQGLKLGNKLSSNHIGWKSQPMKVKLATQTLSESVATAIDYCRDKLHMTEFQGSEATVKFIRTCDKLFDIFNTKNIFAKNFKSPLNLVNENKWRPFLDESFVYLTKVRTSNGKLAIESPRKAAFLGFLTLIKSTEAIFDTFVKGENPPLKYLLTYKYSQDHLELFFSSVRSRNGFNNNPSAKQFMASFTRLLVNNHDLKHTAANCSSDDTTTILNVSSASTLNLVDSNNLSLGKFPELNELFEPSALQDHDYSATFTPQLSRYVEDVVEYIAGFVVRKLIKAIKCPICAQALISEDANNFILHKNRGGLTVPSRDVVRICKEAERICLKLFHATKNNPPQIDNIINKISCAAFANLPRNLFTQLSDHLLDFETFGDNHIFELKKQIIATYSKIRLHHFNTEYNIKIRGRSVRQQLTKIVLFKHQ